MFFYTKYNNESRHFEKWIRCHSWTFCLDYETKEGSSDEEVEEEPDNEEKDPDVTIYHIDRKPRKDLLPKQENIIPSGPLFPGDLSRKLEIFFLSLIVPL